MAANVSINEPMLANLGAPFDPWRRTSRGRFGWAGALSLAVHGLVGVLAMGMLVQTPRATSAIRVFLVAPPPPPPPAAAIGASPAEVVPQPRPAAHPVPAVRQPAPRIRNP